MGKAKVVRVRKARRNATVACGHLVVVGQRIVSKQHQPWTCLACATAGDKQLTVALAHVEPARAGE